jgi:cell division protein FtsQ
LSLWHDVRLLNMTANGLIGAALIALVSAALAWAAQRPMFSLREVIVEGVDSQPLKRVTLPSLKAANVRRVEGSFFTVDLAAVRRSFEQVPWVRRAHVRRIWPNQLHVALEEHRPLAVWNDGRLVNDRGELFVANLAEAEDDGPLLEFAGPPGSELQVMRRWTQLARQLAPLAMRPQAVQLSDRYAWTVRMEDGMTLLIGREQGVALDERVERWVAAHPQVLARVSHPIQAVDLRYPHGFAVHAPGAIETAAAAAAREKKMKRNRVQ